MIAWALTYLVHSTGLVALAAIFGRLPPGRGARVRDALWKGALAGALVTATVHQATSGAPSFTPPIHVAAPGGLPLAVAPDRGGVWLLWAWAAGSAFAACRLFLGWRRLRRAAHPRRVLTRGPLRETLDAILLDAAIARPVMLSCSRTLAVPRAIGRSEICVPLRALRDLSPAEQRALLAHEAAHLQRHDTVWLFAAALLQTLAWWQPLTRVAAARLRQAMELCCDDWAASRRPDRLVLAACLVKVGEWGVAPGGWPVTGFAARGSALRERIERLLDDDGEAVPAWPGAWIAAAPAVLVLALAPWIALEGDRLAPLLARPIRMAAASPTAVPPALTLTVAGDRGGPASHDIVRPPASDGGSTRPVAAAGADAIVAAASDGTGAPSAAPVPIREEVIAMTEPLSRPGIGLRAAVASARVPSSRPVPPPLIGPAGLEVRIGVWLEYQRRHPPYDPLRPNYGR